MAPVAFFKVRVKGRRFGSGDFLFRHAALKGHGQVEDDLGVREPFQQNRMYAVVGDGEMTAEVVYQFPADHRIEKPVPEGVFSMP